MANNNVKRLISEEGVVLEKIFKKATNEFKSSDGRIVPAQPDRYILLVVSGEEWTKENGYLNSNILEYPVEKDLFDKVVGNSKVTAQYELSNYGAKARAIILK